MKARPLIVGLLLVSLVSVLAPETSAVNPIPRLDFQSDRDAKSRALAQENDRNEARHQSSIAAKAVSPLCAPGSLPSSTDRQVYNFELDWFGDIAAVTLWREPCQDDPANRAILMRIEPLTGAPFVCGAGWFAVQDNRSYQSIRLLEASDAGGSFCTSVTAPITLLVDQYAFLANFDERAAFDLYYDAGISFSTASIPGLYSDTNRIYFANPASNGSQISSFKLTNNSLFRGEVLISGVDENGNPAPLGDVALELGPAESVTLTAVDLETGNPAKGLDGAFGDGAGKWQISVRSETSLGVQSLLGTPEGFLTSMSEIVPVSRDGTYPIYYINPASNTTQQTMLFVSNPTAQSGNVRIDAVDEDGSPAESAAEFSLGPYESLRVVSSDLEQGNISKGVTGGFGDGTGKWVGTLTSDLPVEVISLIRTPDGFLTNLSRPVPKIGKNYSAMTVNPDGDPEKQTLLWISNSSAQSGQVTITGIDDVGNPAPGGAVSFTLEPFQSQRLTSRNLEIGGKAGVSGALGNGQGMWRLNIASDLDLDVLSLNRTPDGFLTNLSEPLPRFEDGSWLVDFFNPAQQTAQASSLRIVNKGDAEAQAFIHAWDETGAQYANGDVTLTVPANGAVNLSASDIEAGNFAKGLTSGIGNGTGSWRLVLESDSNLAVMSLVDSLSGFVTNLSRTVREFHNIGGTISLSPATQVDNDVFNPDDRYAPNDDEFTAQQLSSIAQVGGFVNVPNSPAGGESGRSYASGDDSDVYAVDLAKDQVITLEIADEFEGDLDLGLFTNPGVVLVDASLTLNKTESLVVPADGRYFIQVFAASGASAYTLFITPPGQTLAKQAERLSDDFPSDELIIKFSEPFTPSDARVSARNRVSALGLEYLMGRDTGLVLTTLHPGRLLDRQRRIAMASDPGPIHRYFGNATDEQRRKLELLYAAKGVRQADKTVSAAFPNLRFKTQFEPNDQYYPYQWHYPQIFLPQAWDVTFGSPDVTVAVIDSGIVVDHPEFSGRLRDGYDFYEFDADPSDPGLDVGLKPGSFHGTHVAGTVAAATDNGIGVAGVAPGVQIMPLRVGVDSSIPLHAVINAILYAAGLENDFDVLPSGGPAEVINLSLGGFGYSQATESVIEAVRAQGVIVVAAAGNDSTSRPSYPASYAGVVSVSALDIAKQLTNYSNVGFAIDVAAPGGNTAIDLNADGLNDGVLSTVGVLNSGVVQPSIKILQGTSMAAPHVAGVAALMKSIDTGITPAQFDALIQSGNITNDLGEPGRDDLFGYGLINAKKAVDAAGAQISTTPWLYVSPGSASFFDFLGAIPITTSNAGGGQLVVQSVTENASWLQVDADPGNKNGVGRYTLSVNRNGLEVGTYSTIVSIASNGGSVSLPISMRVIEGETTTGAGRHYVLLIDGVTGETLREVAVDSLEGEYPFTFEDVRERNYVLLAGSDLDNDNLICEEGEACGAYPSLGEVGLLSVDSSNDQLNFPSGYLASVIGLSSASNPNGDGLVVNRRQKGGPAYWLRSSADVPSRKLEKGAIFR